MKCRAVIVLAACLCLFALAGRAWGGLVIDESFDANPAIQSPMSSVDVGMMTMGMWMGGGTPQGGMWVYDNAGHAMGMLMGTGMGMMGMPTWSTLTYFVAKPTDGWGGNRLDLSFDFQYTTAHPADTEAKFGVYAWPDGAPVGLMEEFPGADGTELIGGLLTPSGAWSTVTETHMDAFARSPYIGVTFTIGDKTGALVQGELAVDDVQVNITPEPGIVLLSSLAVAALLCRRRRKNGRRRAAAGPSG
ncbi:MAG TPA: hypothetical protein VNA25_28530 [Phycisphaerae bacterium]|nr:hypothetical protein [Phycisphaerae bacterium]